MKSFFSLLVCLGLMAPAQAQTDVSHFYIAYDVSGSVGSIDQYSNLQKILFSLLDIDSATLIHPNSNYERAISFSLYPFGNGLKTPLTYNATAQKDKSPQVAIAKLISNTSKNRNERYSDLLQTLKDIDSALGKAPLSNTGVFIFTDGNLSGQDVPAPDDLATYKTNVAISLLSLKRKLGPEKVFIVQTSQSGPIFQFADSVQLPRLTSDSMAYSPHYFWIDARQDVQQPKYRSGLNEFFQQAMATIATEPYLPLKDEQQVAITLQEIYSTNEFAPGKPLPIQDKTNPDTSLKEKVDQLYLILNDSTWDQNKVVAIKKMLKDFKATTNTDNIVSRAGLDLNVLKRELQDQAYDAKMNNLEQRKTGVLTTGKVDAVKEPVSITITYAPAAPTAVPQNIRSAKSWENMEQQLIEGMADFVVKRAKMEVTYAFVDNLKEVVFRDDAVMTRLFPATDNFVTQPLNKYDMLVLTGAIKKDLNTLPERIIQEPAFVKTEKLYSFWMYLKLYHILMERGSLEDAFKKLKQTIDFPQPSEKALIDTMRHSRIGKALILAVNLIDNLNNHDFAKAYAQYEAKDQLQELSAMLFAMALDTTDLGYVKNIPAVKLAVVQIYQNYNAAKQQIQTLQQLSGQMPSADFEGYRRYQKDLLLDILRRMASLLTSGATIIQYLEQQSGTQVAKGGKQQKDEQVISPVNSYRQGQVLINDLNNGIDAWFYLKDEKYADAMVILSGALLPYVPYKYRSASVFLVASGEIVSARSPEEISNIIARHTLPVASHTTKKLSGSSLMLTAYAGLSYVHYQFLNEINNKDGLQLLAVIGPEYTIGIHDHCSVSFMLTLLDLGNIIQFQLQGDSPKKEDVTFARIFSPGLLIAGAPFRKLPLAFTASYMFNPARFQLGIALDMPLLGLGKWRRRQ